MCFDGCENSIHRVERKKIRQNGSGDAKKERKQTAMCSQLHRTRALCRASVLL
jgi:hypothetical protein